MADLETTGGRARPMRRGLAALTVAAIGFGLTAPAARAEDAPVDDPVSADPDSAADCGVVYPADAEHYNDATMDRDDGWLGADATGQVDLGDDRLLWLMGDTDWGRRNPDQSYAGGWKMTTNSAFVQVGACLDSVRPSENLVDKPADADLYWPLDGWVVDDDLFLVMTKVQRTGGTFGFRSAGHEVVRLDLATFAFERRWSVPDPARDWGSSVERVDDTLYWFGRTPTEKPGNPGHMFLARSDISTILTFEYRTATGWSTSPAAAVPIHRRATPSNASFTRLPDGRWALVTVGTHRIRVDQWLPDDPYPRAEVTDHPDPTPAIEELGLLPDVTALLRSTLAKAAELGDTSTPATTQLSDDPVLASHQASALAPISTIDQYGLLAAESVGMRLATLHQLLGEAAELLDLRLEAGNGDGEETL